MGDLHALFSTFWLRLSRFFHGSLILEKSLFFTILDLFDVASAKLVGDGGEKES